MPKKEGLKEKTLKEKSVSKTETSQNVNIEKVLIENFISLQKVMTNLALKFDNLATQISKLLELFEISAKTLAEKDITLDRGRDERKVIEKLDTLFDQNKIIARGLTLLHERGGEIPMPQPAPQSIQQQMPVERPTTAFQSTPVKRVMGDGYQKSAPIKSQVQNSKPRFTQKNAKIF